MNSLCSWLSLTTLMCALLALPHMAHAQKGAALTAAVAPGPGCNPSFTASQTTICQGGSAVLTYNEGCYPAGPATYAWAPAHDISALNSNRVAVNPLVTTTYTLTRTDNLGQVQSFPVTITVQANCCQTSTVPAAQIVQLGNDYLYNHTSPTHNDPFQQYPAGTYFHVTGNLTLRDGPNSINYPNDKFTMKPGMVLLMDAGASVIVQDGARLETNGSTITAACNGMWGGLRIAGSSDLLDMHAVSATSTTALMHNRILHSQQGIVLEDQGPEFQINFTDFLHNYTGLDVDRRTASFVHPVSAATNKLLGCTFNSDPGLMKAPYAASGANYWYTDTHLRVAGNLGSNALFFGNTFTNALFCLRSDRTATPLTLYRTNFTEFLLAGVYYDSPTGALSAVTGNDVLTLPTGSSGGQSLACTFTFRSYKPLPPTSQLTAALATYGATLPYGTTGIRARGIRVNATAATFRQLDPADYSQPLSPSQVGIHATNLTIASSNFEDLAVGIAHDVLAGTSNSSITQNLFNGCGSGYEVTALGGSTSPTNAGTVMVDCNTFNRVSPKSMNSGQYSGIYLESGAYAYIIGNTPTSNPNIAKNKFDDGGPGIAIFQAINNSSSNKLIYDTYDDVWQNAISPLISTPVDLALHQQQIIYVPNTACISGNGLLRSALPNATSQDVGNPLPVEKPQLDQSTPNPTQGPAHVGYHLPKNTQNAALLIRRAIDGQQMQVLPLVVTATAYELDLTSLPAGTYFYTLIVDSVPAITRRLVVQ